MALKLSGTNDSLVYVRSGLPSANSTFTVCGWFHLNTNKNNNQTFISIRNSTSPLTGSNLTVRTNTSDTSIESIIAGVTRAKIDKPVFANQWNFVSIVCNSNNYSIYHGYPTDDALSSASNTFTTFSINEISFGENPSRRPLDGKIAGLMIYNTALTEEQLNVQKGMLSPAFSNCTHWYPMIDDVAASNLIDYSGNNYTAGNVGAITVEDGPPIVFGNSPIPVYQRTEQFYGQSFPYTLKSNGITSTAIIDLPIGRAGETHLVSLTYRVGTQLSSIPSGWSVINNYVYQGACRVDLTKPIARTDIKETLTLTLPANVPWVAHAMKFTGVLRHGSAVGSATANIHFAPTMRANTNSSILLQVVSNTTGNVKYLLNSNALLSDIDYVYSSNATAGIGSTLAVLGANTSTLNYGNSWLVYDIAAGNAHVIQPNSFRSFPANVRYNAIFLRNTQVNTANTVLFRANLISKADGGRCLDFNYDYTVMFEYFHMPDLLQGTHTRQHLWSLCNKWGDIRFSINMGLFDSVFVRSDDYIVLNSADGINGNVTHGIEVVSTQPIAQNTWHNVAVVKKGDYLHGFINGSYLGTIGPIDATHRDNQQSNYTYWGGRHYPGYIEDGEDRVYSGAYLVRGAYANIREWNVALTVDEINFEMSKLFPVVQKGNLFAHYPTIGNSLADLATDYVAVGINKNLTISSNTTNKYTYIENTQAVAPVLVSDNVIFSQFIIEPKTETVRGLYLDGGNVITIPENQEKQSNVLIILSNGTIMTSNVRNADFYVNKPSGQALILSSGNIITFNSNTQYLIT